MDSSNSILQIEVETRLSGASGWTKSDIKIDANNKTITGFTQQGSSIGPVEFDSFMGPDVIKKCRKPSKLGMFKKSFDRKNRYDFIKDGKVVLSINFYFATGKEESFRRMLSNFAERKYACLSGGRKLRTKTKRRKNITKKKTGGGTCRRHRDNCYNCTTFRDPLRPNKRCLYKSDTGDCRQKNIAVGRRHGRNDWTEGPCHRPLPTVPPNEVIPVSPDTPRLQREFSDGGTPQAIPVLPGDQTSGYYRLDYDDVRETEDDNRRQSICEGVGCVISGGRKRKSRKAKKTRKRKNHRRKTRKNKRKRKRGGVKESKAPDWDFSDDFPVQSKKDLQEQQLIHGKENLVRSMFGFEPKKKKAALVHPIGGRKRRKTKAKKHKKNRKSRKRGKSHRRRRR